METYNYKLISGFVSTQNFIVRMLVGVRVGSDANRLTLTGAGQNGIIEIYSSRGGAVAARRAHNPKVIGSNPIPATNLEAKARPKRRAFFSPQSSA